MARESNCSYDISLRAVSTKPMCTTLLLLSPSHGGSPQTLNITNKTRPNEIPTKSNHTWAASCSKVTCPRGASDKLELSNFLHPAPPASLDNAAMGSIVLPHLRTAWHVDQAILSEEERLVVIRFGRDHDPDCESPSLSHCRATRLTIVLQVSVKMRFSTRLLSA